MIPTDCDLSLYEWVRFGAEEVFDRPAVSFFSRKITYGEIFRRIDRLADRLSASIGKGDTATLCAPNSPSALIAFYALNKLGATVNLLHPFLPPDRLRESAARTNSRLLILFDQYFDRFPNEKYDLPVLVSDTGYFMGGATKFGYRLTRLKKGRFPGKKLEKLTEGKGKTEIRAAKFGRDEAQVLLSSGGTTGKPKSIRLGSYALNYLCSNAQFFLCRPVPEYRSMYSVLPIFHGFGLCMNMHISMTCKLKNVMCVRFDADKMARAIEREKVQIVTGVPTMYYKLLSSRAFRKADLSSLTDAFVGGDVVRRELLDDFTAALRRGGSGATLYTGYGLTETVTVCAVNTAAHCREGSVGYPLPGTEFRVVRDGKPVPAGESGEILIRTEQLMLGYLGEEDDSCVRDADGTVWLKTGDEGHLDADGFLFFRQRMKNVFKVSGVPVYPSEIEDVLGDAEGVGKLCAMPKEDAVRGNVVTLWAELRPGADAAAAERAIRKRAEEKLMPYARPKEIVFVDRLPLSLIGKIDRLEIARRMKEEKDGIRPNG